MNPQEIIRDERSVAIENTSYRIAYLVMSFGLLLVTAYRGLVLGQSSWDLLGLVILGGATATLYQAAHKVLTPYWIRIAMLSMVAAALVAMLLNLLQQLLP
jgi:hypothetical protein